jgi:hypothetical protein
VRRHPPLTLAEIAARLDVDAALGKVFWRDPSAFHPRLLGREAGGPRASRGGKSYWIVKLGGIPYRRSQIVLCVKTGSWPTEQVDHIDGDSLNDRGDNLRHASQMQNAWNHKTRRKASSAPMGTRRLPGGRYVARLRGKSLGSFASAEEAVEAYRAARLEAFGSFA